MTHRYSFGHTDWGQLYGRVVTDAPPARRQMSPWWAGFWSAIGTIVVLVGFSVFAFAHPQAAMAFARGFMPAVMVVLIGMRR